MNKRENNDKNNKILIFLAASSQFKVLGVTLVLQCTAESESVMDNHCKAR